jgi:hypothetical protein
MYQMLSGSVSWGRLVGSDRISVNRRAEAVIKASDEADFRHCL